MVVMPQVSGAGAALTSTSLLEALALGPAVWDSLLAQGTGGAASSPFMSWSWHRAWADSAPAAAVAASEAFVLRDSRGVPSAIVPVLLQRITFHRVPATALTWAVGDLGCPDHLDVLAGADADFSTLGAVLAELPWDVLILSNLAPNAPGAARLCAALGALGYSIRSRPLWVCPYLELRDSWDLYLGTLTPNRRQLLRRKERSLRRDHVVTITDYDRGRLHEGLNALIKLHTHRWEDGGQSGAFHEPAMRRLHSSFAAELAARGQLWLSTLDVDGEPAAAWYGFASGDTVYFYQSGRDPRWARESVGQILMGTMLRRAIERGYRRVDFLRGDDEYKRHWTATTRTTEEITIFRPGWRGRWLRGVDTAASLRARLRG